MVGSNILPDMGILSVRLQLIRLIAVLQKSPQQELQQDDFIIWNHNIVDQT